VLGLMEMRGMERPYFLLLTRDQPLKLGDDNQPGA